TLWSERMSLCKGLLRHGQVPRPSKVFDTRDISPSLAAHDARRCKLCPAAVLGYTLARVGIDLKLGYLHSLYCMRSKARLARDVFAEDLTLMYFWYFHAGRRNQSRRGAQSMMMKRQSY